MIRRLLVLGTLVSVLVGPLSVPAGALAAGPIGGQPALTVIPPVRPDGPVTLPDGRVLPVEPASAPDSSVEAEMLASHAGDRISFVPGDLPAPLDPATATLGLSSSTSSRQVTLPLAQPGAATSTLAVTGGLPNGMRKEVLGFLPYWMLDAASLQWMQYQLVTTIAYFGVAARSDGSLAMTSGGAPTSGWAGWTSSAMTNVINAAHARGVRVVLTVTMMAWDGGAGQAALLASAGARALLVNGIVTAVHDRAADGINLDFEPVATPQRDQYTSFVRQLKAALQAAGVGSYLTVDATAGAATWASGYDLAGLTAAGAADAIFVMGYDYSWSGSARAGGVAPMESPYILDVGQSVNDYLSIIPAGKIIWGVPYYGRTWQTTTGDPNSPTRSGASGASKAYYYTGARDLAAAKGRRWDDVGKVPWFSYYDTANATWVEGYYDDATSLAAKFDMVNAKGLAGTGMWTLLMDQGDNALWGLIANKFLTDTSPPTGGIRILPARVDETAVLVSWAATDVGSGVQSYSIQVRDTASSSWTAWLTGTKATAAYYVGVPGHGYEFRVAATDFKGNAQPWLAASPAPGTSIATGGFADVTVDSLNVRAGAGTSFSVVDTLAKEALVAVLAGPITTGGYDWYEVQFGFSEWPSSDYPRLGWVAAGSGATPYLAPAAAPSVTALDPTLTDYGVARQRISPNGDGVGDTTAVTFTLPSPTTATRLNLLSPSGQVVDGIDLGPMTAGTQSIAWDGDLSSGAPAPAGTYLLQIAATDAGGTHLAPSAGVDAGLLSRWGVTIDLTAPTAGGLTPTGSASAGAQVVGVTFNEPVTGVDATSVGLVDSATSLSVPGVVAYDPGTRRATLTPSVSLARGGAYAVTIGGGIRDLAGNPMAPISWSFTVSTSSLSFAPPRSLTFLAGSHTGYRFDTAGHVIGSKVATLARSSSAPTNERNTGLPAQPGAWFQVTAGIWAGYWVKESASVYLPGIVAQDTFMPTRSVSFAAGTYTGYRFDATWGSVIGTKAYTLTRASSASASSSATISGRAYLLITNGVWAGYWIPTSTAITLR